MKEVISIPSIFEKFSSEELDLETLNDIRGGGVPRTRDKDVFDFDEE